MVKNNSSQAPRSILMVLAICFITMFSMSFSSAFEFDNVKKYDSNTRTATIVNAFGLGSDLGIATLKTPKSVRVSRGVDKLVGEFDWKQANDETGVFGTMSLTDLKNKKSITRNGQYKVLTYKDVLVDEYEDVCENKTSINGTIEQVCERVEIGSHWEVQTEWKPIKYDTLFLKDKTYRIGIFVDVEEGDWGDWKPTIFGVEVPEWASWTESLNTDLVAYYKLDEASGTVAIDSVDAHNGTYINTPTLGATGKIGTAVTFEESTNEYTTVINHADFRQTSTFSYGGWFKTTDTTQATIFISMADKTISQAAGTYLTLNEVTVGAITLQIGSVDGVDTEAKITRGSGLNDGNWHHVIATYNGTHGRIYIDGSLSGEPLVMAAPAYNAVNYVSIGSWHVNGGYTHEFDGTLDEIAYWSRALISDEVIQLWNNSNGISYTNDFFVDNPPNTTSISPANNSKYATVQIIDFTCYGSDNVNFTEMEFYLNGTLTQTNSSGLNNTNYIFTETLDDGVYNWSCIGNDNESQQTESETRHLTIDTTPFIKFVSPTYANGSKLTTPYIPINVSLTETYFENVTFNFYKGGILNESITFTDGTRFYNKTLCTCDTWEINTTTWTSTGQSNSTETRIYFIDIAPPTITEPTNLTNLYVWDLPSNSTWSFNASDPNIDKCFYNTTDHSNTIITCNSTIQTTWTTQGNKTIISCANDTFGFETCQTNYIYVYHIIETQAENFDPVGEGTEVTFNFTINMTNIPSTTAYLILNNTNYTATTSQVGTNGYYFERSVVIPNSWGNSTGNIIDWNWIYNITGVITNQNTDTTNITVYELAIDDCSVYGEVILNISLKDEKENTLLFPPTNNETIIEVDLEITAIDNSSLSWTYSNTWNEDADGIVQVCIPSGILTNSKYRLDYTMGFSAENYVQEFYYLDNGSLDSTKQYTSLTTSETNLFDLLLADSTTFLFKFYNNDGLEASNGLVHVFRKYIGDGQFREVERGKQDNNGETHLHLVEEDVIYYFKVSLNGEVLYTSSTYNAKCLSTPCQIELEASGDFQEFDDSWDLTNGSYSVSNDPTTRQVTLSYLLDNPQYMNLTIFKYTNNPNTMEVVGSDQAYSTGGSLTVTIPQVAGNVSFIAVVYQDGEIIDTEWVDFNPSGRAYFGATGIFMALLLIICLILMAASEGEGTLIFSIIGLILVSSLKLIDLDYYALVGLICAAMILLWKVAQRRRR